MGQLGDNPEIYRVDEPQPAPVFVPAPTKKEPTEVPDWLNPNKVREPARKEVAVPLRTKEAVWEARIA